MSSSTIGEVAERSGFSASALRYYERIGLVEPSTRTERGYRQYDDAVVDRLAFITRAKRLGCSLGEIGDLLRIRDGERCAAVQQRFHELVSAKIRSARTDVAELTALTTQLQEAAAQLGGEPVDGPCGADCACMADRAADPVMPGVDVACTLDAGSQPGRVAEWSAVLAAATRRTIVGAGARVEFGPDVDLGELARLVGAEQRCCAFLTFTLTIDTAGVVLEVGAPEPAAGLVTDLFVGNDPP